jgi:hypothetical protein
MEPGIQLMLRIEREAEVQRRPSRLHRDNFEKSTRPLEQDNPIKRTFNLFRQKLTTTLQQGDSSPCQTRTKTAPVKIENTEQCKCA